MTRAQFQQFQKKRLQNVLIRQKGPWRLFGQYWIEARRADLQTMDTALWQGRRTLSQYHMPVTAATTLWFRAPSRSSYLYGTLSVSKGRPWLESFCIVLDSHSAMSWKCCFLIWWFFDLLISWFKDFIPAVDGRPGWMSMTTLFVPVFMQHITPKILPSHIFYPYKSFLGQNHQKHS